MILTGGSDGVVRVRSFKHSDNVFISNHAQSPLSLQDRIENQTH